MEIYIQISLVIYINCIVEGHYGANQESTNLNTGQIESRHYDILTTLKNLAFKGIIDPEKQNAFDDSFELEGKKIAQHDAMNFHSVLSTGTYGDFKSYHDEFDKSLLTKKLESASLIIFYLKIRNEVTIPGTAFFLVKQQLVIL